LLLGFSAVSAAEEKAASPFATEQLEFFETSVRPLLVARCQECHGPSKQEGKLRLDSREAVLAGGENGPAAVAGDPEHSLLVTALHYRDDAPQMPPKGKLDDEKIAALTKWVKLGLPWSTGEGVRPAAPAASLEKFVISDEDRAFWSFRPVVTPPIPAVKNPQWTRTSIDPFILEKLEAKGFAPAAPANKHVLLRRVTFDLTGLPPTLDEMAAFAADDSPEAFAKVVDRLLESPQYGERMARLWLDIARFGEDQAHTFEARQYPQGFRYRDWVVGAFNKDLPYDDFVKQQIAADQYDGSDERLAALGYFACGPVYYGDRNSMDQISDRIDTLSRGFLGLTVACARCHDHKFDPISTVDYYALAGVFASTEYIETPLVSAEEIAEIEKSLTDKQKQDKKRPKKYPFVHALKDADKSRDMRVHVRGNAETLGPEAPRRFLEILSSGSEISLAAGSGRKQLAEAIADPNNPLTARVLVNRIWQQHFGKGLVRTASNFGALGQKPSHPELLDHLASFFVSGGWSIKRLHREIILSATYQQSGAVSAEVRTADPENLLLSHMDRRRLEVEPWRDALLAVSGRLETQTGGPSADLAKADNRRRTLYGFVSRHELDNLLRLFDFPDPNITSDQRAVTTVPLQQLFVLNSEFMVASAKALVERLNIEAADDKARVERAYQLLYARPPREAELKLALEYLSVADLPPGESEKSVKLSRWECYAQALLAANEFMYVD
jgi:mono/diheme cytochrome c family protein